MSSCDMTSIAAAFHGDSILRSIYQWILFLTILVIRHNLEFDLISILMTETA